MIKLMSRPCNVLGTKSWLWWGDRKLMLAKTMQVMINRMRTTQWRQNWHGLYGVAKRGYSGNASLNGMDMWWWCHFLGQRKLEKQRDNPNFPWTP
jgi:hypothetical protein